MNYTPIPQAQVFLNNTCSLKCNFCMNKQKKLSNTEYKWPWEVLKDDGLKVATTNNIKKYIDYLVKMGVKRIELGTTIGEPLEHNIDEFEIIAKYIETIDQIESYFFYTNLTKLTLRHINIFNECNKLQVKISCYGLSSKQFLQQTGYNVWGKFVENFKLLGNVDRKMKILLAIRNKNTGIRERYGWYKLLALSRKMHHDIIHEYTPEHFNWKDTIDFKKNDSKTKNTHKGHCGMIYTDCGILGNGDFTICAWLDLYSDSKIGNIHENTPQEMLKLRQKIIDEQDKGIFKNICTYCKLYVPSNSEKANQAGVIQ